MRFAKRLSEEQRRKNLKILLSNAGKLGTHLNPESVRESNRWRENRIKTLLAQDRTSLSNKERHEAQRFTERWDFWNYKVSPSK